MIYNVHLLRVVAALAVVYCHIASEAGLNLPLTFGPFGVDIFFVVSGFIIAYIGTKTPDSFLLRRFIQIVPFYWSASLFAFLRRVVFPPTAATDQGRSAASAMFVVLHPARDRPSSGMSPTLVLGWTLNYEMYFYALLALLLLCSRRFAPLICSASLTLIVLAIASVGNGKRVAEILFTPDRV